MRKSFLWAVILSALFLSSLYTHATTINPQPGDSIWTIACRIGQVFDEIRPTAVFNDDQSGGIITLSSAGNYWVAENLIYPIVISADEVGLDLNCKKVSSSDGSTNLISVNSGLTRIYIHNGHVVNTDFPAGSGCGVLIGDSCSNIQIKELSATGCGNGIKLDGQDGNEIIECKLVALDLVSNTTGLVLSHADENIIKDCCAFHNTQAGFELLDSEANSFYDCQALKTFGEQSTMGFTSRAGQSNLFQRCIAKKTKTSAWEFCNKAYGFLLTSTEEKTKIIECIVNETDVTSTVSAVAYGVCLEPILLEGSDLLYSVTNNKTPDNVWSVAWSPNGNYIVSGDEGNYVRVFSFDGSSLMQTCSDNTPANNVQSVAWSPDGKYIVSGDDGNYVRVFSFDGSNLTYIDGNNTPTNNVLSVAWSPDGKYIATGDEGNYVRLFSFDGSNLTHINGDNTPGNNVNSVAWSPNGKYIASGDDGDYVRVFSFDGFTLTQVADDNTVTINNVNSVAWSPDGNYIVIGEAGAGWVRVFSFDGSNLIHIDYDTTPSDVMSVAWSPDGKYIVCGDSDFCVMVFSFDGSNLTYIDSDNTSGNYVLSVAWSPDGNYIVSGDYGDYVRVWDAMYGPQNCIIQECTVADTTAYGQFVGTGIAGGGTSCFVSNVCCNNDVNYTYGIPNVFYGGHNIERNTQRPFDNISMPMTQ